MENKGNGLASVVSAQLKEDENKLTECEIKGKFFLRDKKNKKNELVHGVLYLYHP